MLDEFSATVEKIYAAAADASLWKGALRAVENYTGSTGAVLNLVPKHEASIPRCLSGSFSDEDCAEYSINYMWRCPRIAFAQAHPDVPVHWDRLILTESEMDRDATYEWYGSHGLRYYLAGWAGESPDHRAYMTLQRSRRQGHVEREQIAEFKLIATHIERAFNLAVKLRTFEEQTTLGLHMLERLSHAVFALDARGHVIFANQRARNLLDDDDGVACRGGRLQLGSAAEQRHFEKVLVSALRMHAIGAQDGWAQISRVSGGRPYVALVTRFPWHECSFGSLPPAALVVISDPHNSGQPDARLLQEIYGLTDAEARLARALGVGHSIDSAAANLGIQPTTARSELKSVFRKLRVNRQQDMVRLLTSLATMTV